MNKLSVIKDVMHLVGGPYTDNPYYVPPCGYKRTHHKKNYENKNSNIEYYTDEKGNIRRRKIKR